jgi:predicted ABC-type ATPase
LSRPVFTIIAGSNGCGKSTLSAGARTKLQGNPVLDPDAIAKSLETTHEGVHSDIEAGKRVLRRAENLIQARESFTVETTLSGATYLKMAVAAREAGFNVVVFSLARHQ